MRKKGSSKYKTTSTVQYVAEQLRKAILNGTLQRGDRLIQEEWAEKLNVSRMPIREALTQLQLEGLVEMVPNRGAVVTPITREDIEEIYQLRAFLEGLAAEMSLPYLTIENKQQLEVILLEMETLEISSETNEEYIRLNNSFHEVLSKGCRWTRVHKMIGTLGVSPIAPNLLKRYYHETQLEHRRIYEAVLRGDSAELRAAVEYHILHTKNNLIHVMAQLNKEKM